MSQNNAKRTPNLIFVAEFGVRSFLQEYFFVGAIIYVLPVADEPEKVIQHGPVFWAVVHFVRVSPDIQNLRRVGAAFCICQGGEWERNYKNGDTTLSLFESAREFNADMIMIKLSGNCPLDGFNGSLFKQNFASLVNYLNKSGKAKVIVSSEFYRLPAEMFLEAYAKEMNYSFVSLGDLGEQSEMLALGLFEHDGVAHHPGDLGMQAIANRVCSVFDNIILK